MEAAAKKTEAADAAVEVAPLLKKHTVGAQKSLLKEKKKEKTNS